MSGDQHLLLALRALQRMQPESTADQANHAMALHAVECALWGMGVALPVRVGRPRGRRGGERAQVAGVGAAHA